MPSSELERSVDVSVGPHDLYKFKGTVSDTVGNQAYRFSLNGATDGGYISDSGFDQQKRSAFIFRGIAIGDFAVASLAYSHAKLKGLGDRVNWN